VQLYVCYGTFKVHHSHPCANAYEALTDAGYRPKVVRAGGCYGSDPLWPRRRKIRRLTGNYKVPTLLLEDGTIIDGSQEIAAWASAHPAPGVSPARSAEPSSDPGAE
jgi:hypothetical protein